MTNFSQELKCVEKKHLEWATESIHMHLSKNLLDLLKCHDVHEEDKSKVIIDVLSKLLFTEDCIVITKLEFQEYEMRENFCQHES